MIKDIYVNKGFVGSIFIFVFIYTLYVFFEYSTLSNLIKAFSYYLILGFALAMYFPLFLLNRFEKENMYPVLKSYPLNNLYIYYSKLFFGYLLIYFSACFPANILLVCYSSQYTFINISHLQIIIGFLFFSLIYSIFSIIFTIFDSEVIIVIPQLILLLLVYLIFKGKNNIGRMWGRFLDSYNLIGDSFGILLLLPIIILVISRFGYQLFNLKMRNR